MRKLAFKLLEYTKLLQKYCIYTLLKFGKVQRKQLFFSSLRFSECLHLIRSNYMSTIIYIYIY